MSGSRTGGGRGRGGGRPRQPPVEVGIPAERQVGALAVAFRRAIRTPFIIANTTGGVVAFAIVVVAGQPSIAAPLLVRLPVAVGSFAVIACALLPLLVRGRLRAGLESFAWIGRWDALRWTQTTGVKPLAAPEAARDWLEAEPMRGDAAPLVRLARIEPLLIVGDVVSARRIAAGLPTGSPWNRFETLYQRAFIEFTDGARVDRRPLRAAASVLKDPEERLRAEAFIALGEARVALADGRDWLEPLAAMRPRIGGSADGVLRLEVWPTLFRLEVIAAVVVGVVGALIVTLG